ncbi:type I glyceraldehyde-3-phosphate dehydrogenase [Candidatus Kuenenbacteria bacterium CG23_combo_of_CG06-09_8_20_14_all_36_9]|nr:MAG: type I glyceraldehyde-3-phosphate dehydrogenase [Candidatus Kuenenbacteria bacterium CG23_combo_of_CG06-09_8_20_14_all_36_9]
MPKKSSQPIKIAINGFGRIGRAAFKIALNNPKFKVVAVNDLTDNITLAHLLKYDSVYGVYGHEIKSDDKNIYIDGAAYPSFSLKELNQLPWQNLKVDVVLECTGKFVKDGEAEGHLKSGAKKVIISAPVKEKSKTPTYLIGVNEKKYKGEKIISNASCTTNCIAPVTKVINDSFGIKKAFLNTIHSYTADQNLVDGPHKDLRRARSAAENIIPTTTGAAIAVTEVLPELKDKFDGVALRVPTICGSISDITYVLKKKTNVKEVNKVLAKAAASAQLKNILAVSDEPLVSTDIIGNPASAIVDLKSTMILGDDYLKILAWYDNEWAYSCRLVEMAEVVMKK